MTAPVQPGTCTIGIDIGGSKVAAGLVDRQGQILRRTVVPSPTTSAADIEQTVCTIVTEWAQADPVAVGVGAAGWVDEHRRTVRFSPHLAWRHEPLAQRLSDRLGLPVTVDNDANAAAWGEYCYGAGRGTSHMVALTLGTGIGGAVVHEGALWRGRWGMAGEWGHMCVVPDGHPCPCGQRGCWEQYCSAQAMTRAAAHHPELVDRLRRTGADRITGRDITDAARRGDPRARDIVHDIGTWLGWGLANLAAILDPEIFVIGGGIIEAGDRLLEPAREVFSRHLTGGGHRPEPAIVPAHLGNDAGLIGAARLACPFRSSGS